MIVGDPTRFAIESEITIAYDRLDLRGLGYFVIHLAGYSYGISDRDATLLACSFDEVERRITRRGLHLARFPDTLPALTVAAAVADAVYSDSEVESVLGEPREAFTRSIHHSHLLWAPDGDEAFDDGSIVLQIDYGQSVRLIGFRMGNMYRPEEGTLRSVNLPADTFYQVLSDWRSDFLRSWTNAPKVDPGDWAAVDAIATR